MSKTKHIPDQREIEIAESLRRRMDDIDLNHLPKFLHPEKRAKWYRETELYYENLDK